MIDIKVYNDIAPNSTDGWLCLSGADAQPFSLPYVKSILAAHPTETDFRFLLNCNGGNVYEALAIYDTLRTSGKRIHCTIEGACHSAATIILLAAPIGNRTANPNVRALVHEAYFPYEENLTVAKLGELKQQLEQDRQAIINLYAERTGSRHAELSALMGEERFLTADELLRWGFISRINPYTTNRKPTNTTNQMSQKAQEILLKANSVLDRISRFFKVPTNYAFVDADGNALFETDKEDDSLAVGDTAFPDGTFTLPDGRTITITDGVVTEILEAEAAEEVANLRARLANAESLLADAQRTISNLRQNVRSSYVAKGRQGMNDHNAKKPPPS